MLILLSLLKFKLLNHSFYKNILKVIQNSFPEIALKYFVEKIKKGRS